MVTDDLKQGMLITDKYLNNLTVMPAMTTSMSVIKCAAYSLGVT